MDGDVELLKRIYDRFNARDIDGVLTELTDDVVWADGMDGGYVHGREAIREYWTRQWSMVSPHVEPVGFHRTADGAIIAEVRQSVRDLEANRCRGRRTGLKTRRSDTFSVFERARWLASAYRMLPRAQTCLEPERYSGGKGDTFLQGFRAGTRRLPSELSRMARDCWVEVLRCPNCRRTGEAQLSAKVSFRGNFGWMAFHKALR